jgi:tetratricopeptide (TPR) repeat protein
MKNKRPKKNQAIAKDLNNKNNSKKIRTYLKIAVIVVLTIIVYSQTSKNSFTNWDDDNYLTRNSSITDLSWSSISKTFSSFYASNYHPVTMVFLSLEYKLFGFTPSSYHYLSLIIHILNIILLFYFLRQLAFNETTSLLVALLFAVHPMHVESVAWISEQKDLLYSAFYLLSLICYLLFLKNNNRKKWFIFSLIFFLISLLSKSMAVTLPLVLLLIDWYKDRLKGRKIFMEKIPYFILSLLFGVMSILSQSEGGATDIVPDISFLNRLVLSCYAVLFYIFKLIMPIKLSVIHYYPVVTNGLLPYGYYITPIILAAIVLLIVKFKFEKKVLVFGSLFFILTISVVLQLFPVGESIVAERYTYIPYTGLFLIIAHYSSSFIKRKKNNINLRRSLIAVLLIYLLFMTVSAYQRVKVWEDGVSLFSDVLDNYPDNYHAYHKLADAFETKGEQQKAIETYTKAIGISNEHSESYMNRGYLFMQSGSYAKAIEDFNEVLKIKPEYFQAYTNRGITYRKLKDNEKALNDFNKALSINPDDVVSMTEIAQVYIEKGEDEKALKQLEDAIEKNPEYASPYSVRGLYYGQNNNLDKALQDLEKASELDPLNSDIFTNLGMARYLANDLPGALESLDKAILLSPNNPTAYSNRGIARLKLNMKEEACKDWEKGARLGHNKSIELLNKYCR